MNTLTDTIAIYIDANTDEPICQYNNATTIPLPKDYVLINNKKYKVVERVFEPINDTIMNVHIYIYRP